MRFMLKYQQRIYILSHYQGETSFLNTQANYINWPGSATILKLPLCRKVIDRAWKNIVLLGQKRRQFLQPTFYVGREVTRLLKLMALAFYFSWSSWSSTYPFQAKKKKIYRYKICYIKISIFFRFNAANNFFYVSQFYCINRMFSQ